MRRFIAVFLALILVFSLSVSSFAIDVSLQSYEQLKSYMHPIVGIENGYEIRVDTSDLSSTNLSRYKLYYEEIQEDLLDSNRIVIFRFAQGNTSSFPSFIIYSFDNSTFLCSEDNNNFIVSSKNMFWHTFKPSDNNALMYKSGSHFSYPDGNEVTFKKLNNTNLYYMPNRNLNFSLYDTLSESLYFPADIDMIRIHNDFDASSHSLTVNYVYADGSPAADPVMQSLEAGAAYSIPSPDVPGYTPSQSVVSGTMPDEDLTVTVTYSRSFHDLTINYIYEDGSKAADSVTFSYPPDWSYHHPSPPITGYTPDKSAVSGSMPDKDLMLTVTYTKSRYTVSVGYVHEDGSQVAPGVSQSFLYGESYNIPSPSIEGYTPDKSAVSGSMPAFNVSVTVTYKMDSGDSSSSSGSSSGTGGEDYPEDRYDPFRKPSSGQEYGGYDPFSRPANLPGTSSSSGGSPWSGYDPFLQPDNLRGNSFDDIFSYFKRFFIS